MDTLTSEARSRRMALVRQRDTKPELLVRKIVSDLGYRRRYRLNYKKLPGSPDLALPKLRRVIFVHGCFWHRHPDPACSLARLPKSRLDFWLPKLQRNRERDLEKERQIDQLGYSVLVVWECELGSMRNQGALKQRIKGFLEGRHGVH